MAEALNAGQYQPLIDAAAAKYGIDSSWLTRLLYQENGFKPTGTSPAGAQGIAQFMPGTATRYGVNVNDPASSIEGAAHYLSDNLKMFGGNTGLATAAYNWGEGNLQSWLKRGGAVPKETQDYVSNITGTPITTWAGAGGASSRLATQPPPSSPASGPIDPSIIARGGVSPPIPTDGTTPGTTLTSLPAASSSGILPGFGTKQASDDFLAGLKKAGITPDTGQGGEGDQGPPRPSPIMRGPGLINVGAGAQLAPQLTHYSPGVYGQALNSQPLAWSSAPIGAPSWLTAAGPQQAQGLGTSLNSLQAMDPQMYADRLAMLYGTGGGGFGGGGYG